MEPGTHACPFEACISSSPPSHSLLPNPATQLGSPARRGPGRSCAFVISSPLGKWSGPRTPQAGHGGLLFNWTSHLEPKALVCCPGCLLSRPSSRGPGDSHPRCAAPEPPTARRFSNFRAREHTGELVKMRRPVSAAADSDPGAGPSTPPQSWGMLTERGV